MVARGARRTLREHGLRTPRSAAMASAIAGAIVLLFAAGAGAECPAVDPPPAPPGIAAPPQPYVRLGDAYPDWASMPLGVGHVRPARYDAWSPGWQERVRIALFAEAGGEIAGHIHDGWLREGGRADVAHWMPLGTRGLVETAYETTSFVVLERRADGWLRLRYAPPDPDEASGTAWVHECHLRAHAPALRFEPWAERLLSPLISPLYFRRDVPHRLRAQPQPHAAIRLIVAGDHHLEPQEVRGDWMRVIVKQPSDYCGAGGAAVTAREGWVRWRAPGEGPWVWYHTRGC